MDIISKILSDKTHSIKEKINALLKYDCEEIYPNLGCDSSKEDVQEAKRKSRIIYRAIRDNLDRELGRQLLMDLRF